MRIYFQLFLTSNFSAPRRYKLFPENPTFFSAREIKNCGCRLPFDKIGASAFEKNGPFAEGIRQPRPPESEPRAPSCELPVAGHNGEAHSKIVGFTREEKKVQRGKPPPESNSTGESDYTIIIIIVWDSRLNLGFWYYCAIT